MNEYLDKLSRKPTIPDPTRALALDTNPYYVSLRADTLEALAAALNTPAIEHLLSHQLAAEFNVNTSPYDSAIDHDYVTKHIGGSGLHHNLDGSHTFDGAMDALRRAFPDDGDFTLRLHALEHLARDFTTPSGINPFLHPQGFREAKVFLEHSGLTPTLAADLLNFNAAELMGALLGAGALLFRLRSETHSVLAGQAARLATTQFFAMNVVGLLVASAFLLRLALQDDVSVLDVTRRAAIGAGQVLCAAALLPNVPLSVALILGTVACVAGRRVMGGGYDAAAEMEAVLRTNFPRYRSYIAVL